MVQPISVNLNTKCVSLTQSYQPFWNLHKRKIRRSVDSVVLQAGVLDSLIADAREFLSMEDWYQTVGIPYCRGYLLYGPPGTGKSGLFFPERPD